MKPSKKIKKKFKFYSTLDVEFKNYFVPVYFKIYFGPILDITYYIMIAFKGKLKTKNLNEKLFS